MFDELHAKTSTAFELSSSMCAECETQLNQLYVRIDRALDGNEPNLVELCENKVPNNPGLRDHAAIQRLDCIRQCARADQAKCEIELAKAVVAVKVLFRKEVDNGDGSFQVTYQQGSEDDIDEKVAEGFQVELDCSPMFEVFIPLPAPFNPEVLKSTCGTAGYGYYIEPVL